MPSCDAESGNETPVSWNGKKVVVNPTMDTAIGLADIQVIHVCTLAGLVKNLNYSFALGQVALKINFTCLGQGLVCSFDALDGRQLALRSIAHCASENVKLFAQKEISLVPDDQTALF